MKENLNKSNTGASNQAKANYRMAEVRRLNELGVRPSKIAKMLEINYKLVKRYISIFE